MLCSEIMQKNVETIFPDDTCQAAARKMRDRDIGFLPVCQRESKKLTGTVTDRDLAIRLVAAGSDPSTPVSAVMSHEEVVKCRVDDDVRDAEKLMSKYQKARIICVDERDTPVGIISFADLSQRTSAAHTAETLKQVKAPD
jgi:CBS domain-containing protein